MADKDDLNLIAETTKQDMLNHPVDTGEFNWEDLAAGGYSGANSALFGIPDVLVKAASSDAYKQLQALRARNRAASTAGDIAGVLAPTGGVLAKGVGKTLSLGSKAAEAAKMAKVAGALGRGAKYADTASDVIRGAKVLPGVKGGAIQGALAAGEQMAPRVLTGQTDIADALPGIAMGAGVGALAKSVPEILRSQGMANKYDTPAETLKKSLIDSELIARGGPGTRDWIKAVNKRAKMTGTDAVGLGIKNSDQMKSDLLDLMKSNDIRGLDEAKDFIMGEGPRWEELSKKFDASGKKISDLKNDVLSTPEAQDYIAKYKDDGIKVINDMFDSLDKKSNTAAVKQELMKTIARGNKISTEESLGRADVANAIRNGLDEELAKLSPDYQDMKHVWATIQPLRTAAYRNEFSMEPVAGRGSDTAAKILATSMLGGSAGVALGGFDPNDQSTWTPAALKAAAGIAAGSMANKVIPGVTNYYLGKVAEAMNNPKFISALEKIGVNVAKIPRTPIYSALGRYMGEKAPEIIEENKIKDEANKSPTELQIKGPEVDNESLDKKQKMYGQKYIDILGSKMYQYWGRNFSRVMPYEEYVKQVGQATNDFDPKKTAGFLYPDKTERAKFLRDLNVAQKLKDIDIGKTYKGGGFIESILNPAKSAQEKIVKDDMIDTIATLVTDKGNLPTAAAKNAIAADLHAITALPASPEEKRKLLFDKLEQKYGMNYSNLIDLGLSNGGPNGNN